jgi:tetratricopeptide (TPR) repeat protein
MAVLPILLFAVVAPCEEGLKQATSELQQNRPAQALAILQPLVSSCAPSSSFYEILGLANELSGDKRSAEDSLRAAAKLDPGSSRLLTELGAALLRNGKPLEAGKALDRALALDGTNQVILKYAAGAAIASQDWTKAAGLLDRMDLRHNTRAIEQEPILALWLAQALIETGQRARVEGMLNPLRLSMPPALLFSLGTTFAQHGMYATAIDYFNAVAPESADDALYFNLGLSYSHLDRYDDARRSYFAAIDKHPDHVDAYFHVGLDYSAAGQRRMGLPWLYKAYALDSNRSDIAYAFAEQLTALEYFNSAKEVLGDSRRRAPNEAMLLVADGDLKLAEGDSAAAIVSYRSALTERPGVVAALVGMARAEEASGRNAEAGTLLRAAVQQAPKDPIANGELGLFEARSGNRTSSIGHLECAWEGDRSNPEIALQLARAYQETGRIQDALRLLETAAPQLRDSKALHLQLAQLYTALHRSGDAQGERNVLANLSTLSPDVLRFDNPRTYVP